MMGAGHEAEETTELKRLEEYYEKLSEDYLDAQSTFVCESLMFEGERISPDDLPEAEKERKRGIIKAWVYGVDIE